MNGLRQRVRVIVHRHLRFVHRFQQCRLRFRRGAIDFVRKHNIGEQRTGLELKFLSRRIKNTYANHIRRQQI